MKPSVLKAVIVFVLIAAAGGFWYYQRNKIDSREFAGTVSRVEGNKIFVDGVYLVAEHPNLSNPDKRKMVAALVDAQTRLIKERLFLPTLEEAAQTGGRYDPTKLRREQVSGSLNDLTAGNVSITIRASKNIYGRSSFTASEITYIEPVFP